MGVNTRSTKRRAEKAARRAVDKAKKRRHKAKMAKQEAEARKRGAEMEGELSKYLEALPFEVDVFRPEGVDEYDSNLRHQVKADDCTIMASTPRAEAVGFKGEVTWISMSHAPLGLRVYGYGRPETDEAIACALERIGIAAFLVRKWKEARGDAAQGEEGKDGDDQ